jgi:hypothetical protein
MSNSDIEINVVTNQPINVEIVGRGPQGVPGVGEKGDTGEPGPSGVYLGSEEPTDPDVNVWIDDTGGATTITAADVGVVDSGANYTADPKNTETIFAEVGSRMEAVEQAVQNIPAGTASTTTITDTANYYTSDNVEGALAELGVKGKLVASATVTNNIEYRPTAVDIDTDTFTLVAHGLGNNDVIYATLNIGEEWQQYQPNVVCGGMTNTQLFYVVNKTNDTFQISLTASGAAINLTSNGGIPSAKWHFEKLTSTSLTVSGLPNLTKFMIKITGKHLSNTRLIKLLFNSLGDITEWMTTVSTGNSLILTFTNCNVLYNNEITIDTSRNFSVTQMGYSMSANTTSANGTTNIDTKHYCPGRTGLVVTEFTLSGSRFANGLKVEVYGL